MSKERGIHAIPTFVVPETSRCLLALADLAQPGSAIDEAASAAS